VADASGRIGNGTESADARFAEGAGRVGNGRSKGTNVDRIIISDLEVFYCVGVPDEERAKPQRLLLTVEMEHDFSGAATGDELGDTIDYFAVSQRLLKFGDGVHWKLIETLAVDIAQMVLEEFQPRTVTVEVKKFILPQARHVAVRVTRARA
jgi:FolB domain-containing protein